MVWLLWSMLACDSEAPSEPPVSQVPTVDTGTMLPSPTGDTGGIDICEVATWEVAAEPVLRTWCTPCHASSLTGEDRSGAPEGMDFDRWELAAPFAQLIRSAAVPDEARMPPEGIASAEEREWLAHWIDCGAKGEPTPPGPCDELLLAPNDETDPCGAGFNQVAADLAPPAGTDLSCLCDVEGTLTVADAQVDLPVLAKVGGDLVLAHEGLESVSAPVLENVGGSLRLEDRPALSALALPRLRDVGRDLVVTRSGAFARLELEQLTTVGGELRVEGLPTVEQVWLPRVEEVGGSYIVAENPQLVELPFFFELITVGGLLSVRDNPELTEVLLANHMTAVGGIEVGGNQLQTLALPFELMEVGGDVYVHDEPLLVTVQGLAETTSMEGSLRLRNLPSLATLDVLPLATTLGGVWFDDLPALVDPVPSVVTVVTGDVTVTDSELGRLPFVQGLERIDGDLLLRGLQNLDGPVTLRTLASVDGALTLEDTSATALEVPALVASGPLIVADNPQLQGLVLDAYDEVRGDLVLQTLPSFTYSGMKNGLFINGALVLDDLDALNGLEPFWAVEILAGDLHVRNNVGIQDTDIVELVDRIEQHFGTVFASDNG